MSKSKDAGVGEAIEAYLNRQNRPYSAVDIFNNLKDFGKTAVVKACESLVEQNRIKEKVYGKQKVYVADQSKFPDVNDNEIKLMDSEIVDLTEKVNSKLDKVKALETVLKTFTSAVSTKDAIQQLSQVTTECEKYKAKLKILSEGQVLISAQDKETVYKGREKYVKEWRKRKRISNDIVNAILEGYPKSKKELLETIGIETDEDIGVSPPKI
ncbi:hypothetical protein SNE40_003154 [Patella caerulea]|uniref:Homologous-pairing protein 2 homolog n=1 Tax=Patella caerulea TaxID=87958 RepID=A0AAN8K796_PATCE